MYKKEEGKKEEKIFTEERRCIRCREDVSDGEMVFKERGGV